MFSLLDFFWFSLSRRCFVGLTLFVDLLRFVVAIVLVFIFHIVQKAAERVVPLGQNHVLEVGHRVNTGSLCLVGFCLINLGRLLLGFLLLIWEKSNLAGCLLKVG